MNVKDVTVEVKAKLMVDKGTANACLKFVELYANETGENVVCETTETGERSFRFEAVRT